MNHTGTVQAIYAAFGRGDVPAILEKLDADVEWEHDSVDHGVPWLKPRRGRENVKGFFETLAGIDIQRFEPFALLSGDDRVVALIRLEAVVRATGKRVVDLEAHVWTFGENGLVKAFRHIADTHQHLLATRS